MTINPKKLFMLFLYRFTKLPPKYIPIIAATKLVSKGVITKPVNSIHFIASFSGINKNPGLNCV